MTTDEDLRVDYYNKLHAAAKAYVAWEQNIEDRLLESEWYEAEVMKDKAWDAYWNATQEEAR